MLGFVITNLTVVRRRKDHVLCLDWVTTGWWRSYAASFVSFFVFEATKLTVCLFVARERSVLCVPRQLCMILYDLLVLK